MLKVSTLVSFLPLLVSSACPDDTWTPGADPDTCYRVSPGHMGWHAAHQWCGQRGGYLAEVNTMAEQTALEAILSSDKYYWIGLADLGETGDWIWQHSWSEAVWTHWGEREPDQNGQHCAMIWGGHGYYWADYTCSEDTSSGGHVIHALCEAGPGPVTHSVLWLGNSYTFRNEVPDLVTRIAAADGINLVTDSHAESGWTWHLHAESQETREKIRSRPWDTVILQEQSMAPAKPSETVCQDSVPYLDILVQEILSNNPDTKIQFYLTWGHPHGEAEECDEGMSQFCDYSAMQTALTASYTAFSCMKAPSVVAPVGEAFRSIHDSASNKNFLKLYADNGDDHHASLQGSYLSAAMHYLSMFNTEVVGNTAEIQGLDSETMLSMQITARDTWLGGHWSSETGCDACMCGCQ